MDTLTVPVLFRGQSHRSAKVCLAGARRSRSPEETYGAVRPLMETIGATRVADITGVDRIGIPVAAVVRPLAPIQVYSWGKGTTLLQAKISAMMEALERHGGERADPPSVRLPYDALEGPRIALEDLPLKKDHLFSPRLPERWTAGWDLMTGEEVYAPLQLVRLSFRRDLPGETESFQCTSNGLSAGNSFVEALCSGLYECIERDAVTCWELHNRSRGLTLPGRVVDADGIDNPDLADLIARCRRADVEVLFLDCTADTAVPTYVCYLQDRIHPHWGLYHGRGTHLNPHIALSRALTEAAQGRAAYLLGGHDGASLETQGTVAFGTGVSLTLRAQALEKAPAPGADEECDTFEEDVHLILNRLARVGIGRALVWDLTDPDLAVPVIRLVVPGLEGWRMHHYAPGRRGRACAEGGWKP
ncbi:MAG: YcaO-like family protein [Synergistaceae bacterium]|nr:YcaO-like family protein [Synergistaceae bacterium]